MLKKWPIKSAIPIIAVIISVAFGLSNCDKESTSSNCKDKNLTCTVDGTSFQSCVITAVPSKAYIWIQAVAEDSKSSIHLYVPNLNDTGTYLFDGSGYSAQYWQGSLLNNVSYLTDSAHTGKVVISKYDATNKLISGTFSFDAKQFAPAGTVTKTITAGSFTDVKW